MPICHPAFRSRVSTARRRTMKNLILLAAFLPALAFAQPASPIDLTTCATRRGERHDRLGVRRGAHHRSRPASRRATRPRRAGENGQCGGSGPRLRQRTCRTVRARRRVRGEERAEIVSPFRQRWRSPRLAAAAPRPREALEAEVVAFKASPRSKRADAAVRGRSSSSTMICAARRTAQAMALWPRRFRGPESTARKGAAAVVIRSAGTDYHRNPHTADRLSRWGASHPRRSALNPRRRDARTPCSPALGERRCACA